MRDNTLNILIGGEAGQGLVTVGQLLAKSLARSGYSILITQSYQSRIRGGHNTFAIRPGIEKIIAFYLCFLSKSCISYRGLRFSRKHIVKVFFCLFGYNFGLLTS